jgi:N-acetylneuraminic acid mutarotase
MRQFFLSLILVGSPLIADDRLKSVPALPQGFSSFGAAVDGKHVYVYGGHVAPTHIYSTEAVTGKFRRLDLTDPQKGWEELASGTPVQGVALVARQGKLYRIGGMQPRNAPGDKADNHSLASCSVYDVETGKWSDLPPLPAPRSSHDAVVIGDRIYVVGGWNLKGRGNGLDWHDTLLALDLSKETLAWQSSPQPFKRRALNVAAVNGRLYVVGGMDPDSTIEKRVDVFDPKSGKWTQSVDLPGVRRNGFAAAVCAWQDHLFASPADGKLYKLSPKDTSWQEIGTLQLERIAHRMVASVEGRLVVIGGANRKGQNLTHSEVFHLTQTGAAGSR